MKGNQKGEAAGGCSRDEEGFCRMFQVYEDGNSPLVRMRLVTKERKE